MENVFSNNALRYYEKHLLVTPLKQKSKIPVMPKWQDPEQYINYEGVIERFRGSCSNMGLLLGQASGVIAVDIDKDSALNLVPPSPVRKKGKKGETRFFRYNGEVSKKRHDLGIEILSTGNQTVLPPSQHPDGPYYSWITPDTLLDLDPSELPILDDTFKNLLSLESSSSDISKSDGSRCNHGSHTKLSEMLVAGIHAGDTVDQIVKNVLNYDEKINDTVSYFTCPSRNWRSKDKNLNAYSFVIEGFARHIRNKEIPTVPLENIPIVINLEAKKEEGKRKPLPHLRGMGQIMFNHIYDNSLVQRSHYMFASVITTGSIILGNKIRFGKTLPNVYSIIVGESGSGKSSSLNFPIRLFAKCKMTNMLGDTSPASDTGIIQNLPAQRERLDVIDEGDSLFETILGRNTYGKKMASTYATLYTVSGEHFGGKTTGVLRGDKNSTGNIGGCFSPYVSMLIGTTPVGFSKHVDQSIIDSGFLARFLYFFDREKKRSKFKKDRNVEVPSEIVEFVKMWRDDSFKGNINLNKGPMDEFFIKEIQTTPEALLELERTHELIEDIKANEPQDSKIRSILERSMENLEKIAIIDCAFINHKTTDLTLGKENIEWAREFILTHIHNTKIALGLHVTEGPRAELAKKILSFIKENNKVTLSEVTRKFQNVPKRIRDEVIRDLMEIAEVRMEKKTNGPTTLHSS